MPTRELIERVREGLKEEGKEERKQRLVKARILTEQGEFDPHFFPSQHSKGDFVRQRAAILPPVH